MATVRFLVSGRVQGVGFRQFVRQEAAALSLRGWVRNLSDGTLEVAAAGSPGGLDSLERVLHRGPATATVARVQRFAWPAADAELSQLAGFEARRY